MTMLTLLLIALAFAAILQGDGGHEANQPEVRK